MRAVSLMMLLSGVVVSSPAAAQKSAVSSDGVVPVSTLAELALPKKPLDEDKISYSGPPLPNVAWQDGGFVTNGSACFRYDVEDHREFSSFDVSLTAGHRGPTGRLQRLVGREDARLEVHDAWLDATRGRSYVKRTTVVPLTPIASGPRGVVAYAYRVETRVHVLVRTRPRSRGDCGLTVASLDLHARDGDEQRQVVVLDDGKRVRFSASVSRFGGEPRVSGTFVER